MTVTFLEKRKLHTEDLYRSFLEQHRDTTKDDSETTCTEICTRCGVESKGCEPCHACRVPRYCSHDCEKADRPFHLDFCKTYAMAKNDVKVLRESDESTRKAIVWKRFADIAVCCNRDYKRFRNGSDMALVRRSGMRFLVGEKCFPSLGGISYDVVNCRPFNIAADLHNRNF